MVGTRKAVFARATILSVIARLDRAIQYAVTSVVSRGAAADWIPACAGMTI